MKKYTSNMYLNIFNMIMLYRRPELQFFIFTKHALQFDYELL